MKRTALSFLLALTALAPGLSVAQIPNGGFETWSGGLPTGWFALTIPQVAVPVAQTATSHSGSSALSGTVVSLAGIESYPPIVWTKFAVNQRYATFTGWYTFSAVGGDSLYAWLVMYNSNVPIGVVLFGNKATRASYTQFSANIVYTGSGVPDSCQIYLGILGATATSDSPHVGSTFNLDDLALSGTATGVTEQPGLPLSYSLSQNFPNPFNPSTLISYQIAKAGPVRLTVYDILGRQVATLVDAVQEPGSHEARFDAGNLASGMYVYRLQTNGFMQQRKMILQK